jgi:hypothetical protein
MGLLSNARNVPVFNVDAFNATGIMNFISCQANQTTGKPLSREGYGTKRSCICHLVRCHNGKDHSECSLLLVTLRYCCYFGPEFKIVLNIFQFN